MDGAKRTAFAAAIYFLVAQGYARPQSLPTDEVIAFCLSVAEENSRLALGEPIEPKTIEQIADWFRRILK